MQTLLRLITTFALIVTFTNDLIGQATNLPLTRRVQSKRLPKRVKRLISYNESNVVSILITILSSEATYQSTSGNGNYGTLEQLRDQGLIESILAEGHRYGYLFTLRVERTSSESPASFEAVAVPRRYGRTGLKSFYINETGVLRGANKKGAEATINDDPLDP